MAFVSFVWCGSFVDWTLFSFAFATHIAHKVAQVLCAQSQRVCGLNINTQKCSISFDVLHVQVYTNRIVEPIKQNSHLCQVCIYIDTIHDRNTECKSHPFSASKYIQTIEHSIYCLATNVISTSKLRFVLVFQFLFSFVFLWGVVTSCWAVQFIMASCTFWYKSLFKSNIDNHLPFHNRSVAMLHWVQLM